MTSQQNEGFPRLVQSGKPHKIKIRKVSFYVMLKKLKSIDIFKILPHAKSPVKSNLIFRNFLYGKVDDTNSYQTNTKTSLFSYLSY